MLLSAFGVDRRSAFLALFSRFLGDYIVHKAAAEQVVRASGLPWTIVRPVELRNRPPRHGPLINQHAPLSLLRTVSRDLVAEVLVRCLGNELARDRTFELAEGGDADLLDQLCPHAPALLSWPAEGDSCVHPREDRCPRPACSPCSTTSP